MLIAYFYVQLSLSLPPFKFSLTNKIIKGKYFFKLKAG